MTKATTRDGEKLALRLFAASNRNLIARLMVVAVVVTAALPVMPWWEPAIWSCSVFVLLTVETRMVRRASQATDPREKARSVRWLQVLVAYSSVNYSVIAAMFWATGIPVAIVFATVLAMVVCLYFLLLYYARSKLLLCAIAPLMTVVAIGAGHLVWQSVMRGNPWGGVTALMVVVIATYYFVSAAQGLPSITLCQTRWPAPMATTVIRGAMAQSRSFERA